MSVPQLITIPDPVALTPICHFPFLKAPFHLTPHLGNIKAEQAQAQNDSIPALIIINMFIDSFSCPSFTQSTLIYISSINAIKIFQKNYWIQDNDEKGNTQPFLDAKTEWAVGLHMN